ncbi:hypothetical protein BC834DRAFT_966957 [Gloeopeniophorella convolvens]|nr:hypothetical protein BC834DRAFT_966957 [Gloeopeniophorella convolvens]
MSSQGYAMPSTAGAAGFFPSGPSAPHAFSSMHTSPRDQHSMYASLGASSYHQGGKGAQTGAGNGSKGKNDPAALSTAYALSLLAEYTHILDALPPDVSRQYADLRELDAVLSASVHILTTKIDALAALIESNAAPKERRLLLLLEIADEAQRLHAGGDDKIRIAAAVADSLRAHADHAAGLLLHIPGFDPALLARHTVYPHVAPRSYAPLSGYETGRRRRGALLAGTDHAPAPPKRRRAARDDDGAEPVGGRTPRRERATDGSARQRNGARNNKKSGRARRLADRVAPLRHLAPAAVRRARLRICLRVRAGRTRARPRPPRARNPAKRRARPAAASATPTDAGAVAPAAAVPYVAPAAAALAGVGWSGPVHAQLEGPGMPVARAVVPPTAVLAGPGVEGAGAGAPADAGDGGDGAEEVDDGRVYCWCQMGSYGDMVACDDNECEREWFHLPCIGLEVAPEGVWFCEACKAKPKNKRKMARAAAAGAASRRASGNPRAARAPSTT